MLSQTLQDELDAYRIGTKVRALRTAKGLGLQQLGDHSGLSAGMLSKIERGSVVPTLPTLMRIALVFGVGLEHFFAGGGAPVLEIVRADDRLSLPNRAGETPDYHFESLDYPVRDRAFESFLAEFRAGADATEPHEHPGDELLYVIEGEVELEIHGRKNRLGPGDAVYFEASFPHSYRPLGPGPARALVVVSPAA
jgi:transcriptional regulator with XRE-family HTH domain